MKKSASNPAKDSPTANSCFRLLSKLAASKKTWSWTDAGIRLRSPETTSAGQSRCAKLSIRLSEMNGRLIAWKTSSNTPTSRNRGSWPSRKNVTGRSKCRTN
jgi:hypothetical protein